MTFLRHIGILSGVGVGGGSLVYVNTLPRPSRKFFVSGRWAGHADWEKELALRLSKGNSFSPTNAAVYFGKLEVSVPDPYFYGHDREGYIEDTC